MNCEPSPRGTVSLTVGLGLGDGDVLGDALADTRGVGDVDASGAGSGVARKATSTPMTMSTSTPRTMSGHIHGLRVFVSMGEVSVREATLGPGNGAGAAAVISRVAASLPTVGAIAVAASAPARIAGTAALAAWTSPRRSAWAAVARRSAEAGRSAGFLAMHA